MLIDLGDKWIGGGYAKIRVKLSSRRAVTSCLLLFAKIVRPPTLLSYELKWRAFCLPLLLKEGPAGKSN